jgi:hypothetical protein
MQQLDSGHVLVLGFPRAQNYFALKMIDAFVSILGCNSAAVVQPAVIALDQDPSLQLAVLVVLMRVDLTRPLQ